MANSTSPVPQVVEGTGAVAKINELFDAASQSAIGGRNAATTSLLTWGFIGGRISGADRASGTIVLPVSATSYIVMAKAGLAVSSATTLTNWNDSTNYWRLYSVVTNATTVTSYNDERMGVAGLLGVGDGTPRTQSIMIQVGDETTALTVGLAKATFRMPFAFGLSAVRASVSTAPTGSVLTVNINESSVSILSTKITIDATEKTSTTAAILPVISDAALADDAEITIDIDGIGATVAGAGLKVYLIGTKT